MKLTSTNRSIGLIALIVSAYLNSEVRNLQSERWVVGDQIAGVRIRLLASDFWLLSAKPTKPSFVGLVILAERPHPIPSRTRP
jgi:hypothetical protein